MGGTVDPETGEVLWEYHVPLEQQLVLYNSCPPSALAGLACTPIERLDWQFDGHGEPVNAVFEVACKCGGKLFTLSATFEDDEARPPITIACDACEELYFVFDDQKHGYDAAVRTEESRDDDDERESTDLVPKEFPTPHEVIVRFEYPSDLLGDPSEPEQRGREQEMFSWITILARDSKTGRLAFLFEQECA